LYNSPVRYRGNIRIATVRNISDILIKAGFLSAIPMKRGELFFGSQAAGILDMPPAGIAGGQSHQYAVVSGDALVMII
jgi:hypothetical protein